jgi:hypothetical protein
MKMLAHDYTLLNVSIGRNMLLVVRGITSNAAGSCVVLGQRRYRDNYVAATAR